MDSIHILYVDKATGFVQLKTFLILKTWKWHLGATQIPALSKAWVNSTTNSHSLTQNSSFQTPVYGIVTISDADSPPQPIHAEIFEGKSTYVVPSWWVLMVQT